MRIVTIPFPVFKWSTAMFLGLFAFNNCSDVGKESQNEQPGEAPLPSMQGIRGEGEVFQISAQGDITGWAMEKGNGQRQLVVSFYSDDPKLNGELIGKVLADDIGQSPVYSGHYFKFPLPRKFSDGRFRNVFVYAGEVTSENLLGGEGKVYRSYSPNPEGRVYFEENLRNKLAQSCSECHNGSTYENFYYSLFYPSVFSGATRSDNNLINNASGGGGHGGGNRCPGGRNSSPCLEIQKWWDIEFTL